MENDAQEREGGTKHVDQISGEKQTLESISKYKERAKVRPTNGGSNTAAVEIFL